MVFSVEAFLISAVLKSLETTFNICLDIVGEIGRQVLRAISVPLKLLATLMGLVESSRTWSSLSFFLIDRIEILTGYYSKITYLHHHRNASDCIYSQIPPVTPVWNLISMINSHILGDPGVVSRVGRKGRTKVFKYGRRSPWVPTLTELFPKIQADAGS